MQNLFEAANNHPYFKQFKISDLLFTEYKCMAESDVFGIWSHLNYFVYVLAGKMKWRTPEDEFMVHATDMIFVKKGANIIHKYFEEDFCAVLIFMPDDYIRNISEMHVHFFAGEAEIARESVFRLSTDETLNTYAQSLCSYFYREETLSPALLEVKFKELLLNIIFSKKHQGINCYFKSLICSTKTSISAIMEQNFTYNLYLEEFARLCGRSLTVFKRDFKELYHSTPGRWLTEKRLERAKHLLLNTDKKVNELVFECGFENTSHFIRAFKLKYGKSPLKYRQLETT